MPISKNVADLTALALRDRVLTYRERQIIVDMALKEGCSIDEINAFVDSALNERLKSYSKEDLRYCPQCGVPFPLVSNVCTNCGHVLHEQKDSELNVHNLLKNIQQSIDELKSTPKPTLWQVLWYRKKLFLLFAALMFLCAAIKGIWYTPSATTVIVLFIVSIVLWFVALLSDSTSDFKFWHTGKLAARAEKSPVRLADDRYYSAMHRQEMYAAQINTLYGNNSEAQALLDDFSSLANAFKKEHVRNRNMLTISIIGVVFASLLTVFYTPSTKSSYNRQLAQYPEFYRFADYEIPLKIYEQKPISDEFSEYISVSGDAKLSFDINPIDGRYIRAIGSTADIALRVSGVRLNITGEKPDSVQLYMLSLMLYNKDGKRVGEVYGKINAVPYDDISYHSDSLKAGDGVYMEFVTKPIRFGLGDSLAYRVQNKLIEDVKYYSIYSVY